MVRLLYRCIEDMTALNAVHVPERAAVLLVARALGLPEIAEDDVLGGDVAVDLREGVDLDRVEGDHLLADEGIVDKRRYLQMCVNRLLYIRSKRVWHGVDIKPDRWGALDVLGLEGARAEL